MLAESLGRRFISIHHLRLKHSLRNWTTSFYQKCLLFAKENIKRSYHDNARGLYDKIVTVSCAFYNFTFYTQFKIKCQIVNCNMLCFSPVSFYSKCLLFIFNFHHFEREKKNILVHIPNVLWRLTGVAICLNMKVAAGEIYLYVCPVYLLQPTKYSHMEGE